MMRMLTAILTAASVLCVATGIARATPPLQVAEAPELFQRVLTLPGAKLSKDAGAAATGAPLPTFSLRYVYARTNVAGAEWIAVGAAAQGAVDGWLPKNVTQDWHTMLVMRYAPRGQRDRVAFFAQRAGLFATLDAPDSAKRGHLIAAGLAQNQPDPAIIAAEPAQAVDSKTQFYVMPVLHGEMKQLADDTTVRVLEVASAVAQPAAPAKPAPAKPVGVFRVGVVFLLDTSSSMQPYIDAVRTTVHHVSEELARAGTADRVSFGLIGYRSNIAKEPKLEYVTRVFAPLDPAAPREQVLRQLDQMTATTYSTPAWDEDAFAGLHAALKDMDWSPFAARLVVLVTDSGALPGRSPLAQWHNFDAGNVIDTANALHVALFPVHLLTPAGETHGNRAAATHLWQQLSQTGDTGVRKYLPIPSGAPTAFQQALDSFGKRLVTDMAQLAADHPLERPTLTTPVTTTASDAFVAQALSNELFRAQAEFLGAREGTAAPGFFQGWASDHDLGNPRIRSLDVQVFLTRTQLSGLAQSLAAILGAARQAGVAPQDFFDRLQLLSARTAADPERREGDSMVTSIGASNLLPAFLKLLPYRSRILNMTSSEWLSGGVTGQQEFIDELDYKMQQYRDIDADQQRWTLLDKQDPASAVSPVPLDVLP